MNQAPPCDVAADETKAGLTDARYVPLWGALFSITVGAPAWMQRQAPQQAPMLKAGAALCNRRAGGPDWASADAGDETGTGKYSCSLIDNRPRPEKHGISPECRVSSWGAPGMEE